MTGAEFEAALVAAGYHKFETTQKRANHLWQRRIVDDIEHGIATLYFINVYVYLPLLYLPEQYTKHACMAEAIFYMARHAHIWMTLEIHDVHEVTVPVMEAQFAQFYRSMGCIPDRHNQ